MAGSGLVKTTFRLTAELDKEIKKAADKEGVSQTEVIKKALKEYMETSTAGFSGGAEKEDTAAEVLKRLAVIEKKQSHIDRTLTLVFEFLNALGIKENMKDYIASDEFMCETLGKAEMRLKEKMSNGKQYRDNG